MKTSPQSTYEITSCKKTEFELNLVRYFKVFNQNELTWSQFDSLLYFGTISHCPSCVNL